MILEFINEDKGNVAVTHGIRILHLEDNPSDAELIKIELNETLSDIELIQVDKKKDFIEALKQQEFNLVLADFHVPEFSGLESLALLKGLQPNIPYIIVSGAIGEERAIDAFRNGVTDYVNKSALPKLSHVIQRALKEKRDQFDKDAAIKKLKESEAKYRELTEAMKTAVFIMQDGHWVYTNKYASELFEYSTNEFSEISFLNLVHPDYRKEIANKAKARINGYAEPDRYECVMLTKSGHNIHVDVSASTITYKDKPAIMGTLMDITEKKIAQDKLLEGYQQSIRYQSQLLSSQINPHFIYNALNSIQFFVLDQKTENTLGFISEFSQLMRMVLSNSLHDFISLADELKFLELFLSLEKRRFDNKFEYEIIIPEEIDPDELQIPPMLLQPYVENSIVHGLNNMMTGGILHVEFSIYNDEVICSITDNGVGRQRASELNQMRRNSDYKSIGMGLTQTRLNLLNELDNGNFSFQIDDLFDAQGKSLGTMVELRFPKIEIE